MSHVRIESVIWGVVKYVVKTTVVGAVYVRDVFRTAVWNMWSVVVIV